MRAINPAIAAGVSTTSVEHVASVDDRPGELGVHLPGGCLVVETVSDTRRDTLDTDLDRREDDGVVEHVERSGAS